MKAKYLVGVDEAGRGPLAGPVAVGVVCVPSGFNMRLLRDVQDSKVLSEKERERLYTYLRVLPGLTYAVTMISATVIDQKGITEAIRRAIEKSIKKLSLDPQCTSVRLDGGLRAPNEFMNQMTIIKGDATDKLIGAASIFAKVTRDRYMRRAHKKYPEYAFETHKGYGTAAHRALIRAHGLSPLHRKTFWHG